jgi:hypothetical protein
MSSIGSKRDEEKTTQWDSTGTDVEVGQVSDVNVTNRYSPPEGNSLLARLQAFAGKYGVEQRGIERVPEDERTDTSMSQVGTLV